jgi:hypothetical protein
METGNLRLLFEVGSAVPAACQNFCGDGTRFSALPSASSTSMDAFPPQVLDGPSHFRHLSEQNDGQFNLHGTQMTPCVINTLSSCPQTT